MSVAWYVPRLHFVRDQNLPIRARLHAPRAPPPARATTGPETFTAETFVDDGVLVEANKNGRLKRAAESDKHYMEGCLGEGAENQKKLAEKGVWELTKIMWGISLDTRRVAELGVQGARLSLPKTKRQKAFMFMAQPWLDAGNREVKLKDVQKLRAPALYCSHRRLPTAPRPAADLRQGHGQGTGVRRAARDAERDRAQVGRVRVRALRGAAARELGRDLHEPYGLRAQPPRAATDFRRLGPLLARVGGASVHGRRDIRGRHNRRQRRDTGPRIRRRRAAPSWALARDPSTSARCTGGCTALSTPTSRTALTADKLRLRLVRKGLRRLDRRRRGPTRKLAVTVSLLFEFLMNGGFNFNDWDSAVLGAAIIFDFFKLRRSGKFLRKGAEPDADYCVRVGDIGLARERYVSPPTRPRRQTNSSQRSGGRRPTRIGTVRRPTRSSPATPGCARSSGSSTWWVRSPSTLTTRTASSSPCLTGRC